ncbi:uncharacterized protein TNCV_1590351 [Trichonephila clavipes]|nr:uncharacterized protein TNCV_1590351 [Trichonephila clavipes]
MLVVSILGRSELVVDGVGVFTKDIPYGLNWRHISVFRINHYSAAVMENCSRTMTPDVGPVCLDRRQFGYRCFAGLLLTNTRTSLAPRQNLFSSENNRSPLNSPMSSGLTTGVANGNVRCVPVVPTAARISAIDAVRCTTAVGRIRWSTLSVVPCGRPELGLLEAIPSLDYCSPQSCTVDTFLPSLSAISQKENPPTRSPITRPRSNSVSC